MGGGGLISHEFLAVLGLPEKSGVGVVMNALYIESAGVLGQSRALWDSWQVAQIWR